MPAARDRRVAPPRRPSSLEETYVLLASFLVGAIILVVEILGTRVISPYYGASIYVWSSLIGVTLAALTTGYAVGGWVADRRPPLPALALEMTAGALCLVLVPWLRRGVLAATTGLGLKGGSLASAVILFAPPLVLLAMTGPAAIRLVTSDFGFLGRGVGKIYGVSTLGSMLGAILTGFVLIPSFSVRTVLVAAAGLLFVLGAAGFALARRGLATAAALGVGFLAAAALERPPAPASNVVYLGNSFYGELKVVDGRETRYLLINGVENGSVDRRSLESGAPYIALFAYLPAARPQAKRALCIGLGVGSVPRTFQLRHGIATEVVEIDPAVALVARRHFGFPADVPVIIEDGRTYVDRAPHPYDFVVLDAFASETHPVHLFTREFFARVDARLAPGGIFAINMVGRSEGPSASAWRAVRRTVAERFRHLRAFAGSAASDRYQNLFLVASQEPLPAPAALGSGEPFTTLAREELPSEDDSSALVLTDDYNPLDELQRALLVAWREDMIRKTQSILLFDGTL
jgi:spermidine synthase